MGPCYNCKERTIGCHSRCALYAEFKQEVDGKRAQRQRGPVENYFMERAFHYREALVNSKRRHTYF